MTVPFDAAVDLAGAPHAGTRLRPRDAATLILLRDDRPEPRVLMGRRAAGHVFMAAKWVFPGGRIERADFTAASASELHPATAAALQVVLAPRRARALALAAIRETWEETGLLLARPGAPAAVAGPWRDFRAAGALPDLQPLRYIARAVTPPGRARRFDARFFMASALALLDPDPIAGSGELEEIAWLPLDEARRQDLPAITRFVLAEVVERLERPDRAIPFIVQRHGRYLVEHS